jgi:uncharacterized protein
MSKQLIPRGIAAKLLAALQDSPVVLLNGGRQTGKSTLVRMLTEQKHPARYLTLDDPVVLSAIRGDPKGFLDAFEEPLILDEIQRAPEAFAVIKLLVDQHRTPGRFLLTGSANVLLLPRLSESLAGRMEVLTLHPLSQSELERTNKNPLDRLFQSRFRMNTRPASISREDLLTRILKGGFPEAVQRQNAERRAAWFSSYVTTILQRDVRDLAHIEGLTELPNILALTAARSGALVNFAELSNSGKVPITTLKRYTALLEMTYMIRPVPAWSANLGKRLIKAPKHYLCDTGLMAWLLGIDLNRLSADPTLSGMIMETFVLNELTRLATWSRDRIRIHHYRTAGGAEIDFLLERADGAMVAIEVKAGATVDGSAFSVIRALADACPKKFLNGFVIHTGPDTIPFGKNLFALPVSSLWSV